MDEISSRRAAGGLVVPRRGPNVVLRESAESPRSPKDRTVQVCSRVGCSSKLNPVKPTQIGSPRKAKTPKAPFRPPGPCRDIIGSSSRTPASFRTSRKPITDPRKKLWSRIETDSESSSVQGEPEGVPESSHASGKNQMKVHPDQSTSMEAGSSSSRPTNKLVKRNTQRFGLACQQDSPSSSSLFAAKQTNQGTRNNGAGTNKYNLRSLRCNSVSDVLPSGCSSSSESTLAKKRDIGRKRVGEPDSSLPARGKKISGPMMDDKRAESSNRGIFITDSRQTRNLSPAGAIEATSVRTQRPASRTRFANQDNRTRLPLVESPLLSSSSPQPDISLGATALSSETQFSVRNPSSRVSSFGRHGTGGDRTRTNRPSGSYEAGVPRSFMNRDSLRQYNLDGIAEMLLALERIDQEDEPTYEQLLVLETNLFLGGLAFHDQHRDMRLDIDNMSYEELLALEERMGSVNTGVPEADLAKCLKRATYQEMTDRWENEDDVKCCICQEEYADCEEIGRLNCDHRYHVECIHQWLRIKNWCPICKNSALPSSSSALVS